MNGSSKNNAVFVVVELPLSLSGIVQLDILAVGGTVQVSKQGNGRAYCGMWRVSQRGWWWGGKIMFLSRAKKVSFFSFLVVTHTTARTRQLTHTQTHNTHTPYRESVWLLVG